MGNPSELYFDLNKQDWSVAIFREFSLLPDNSTIKSTISPKAKTIINNSYFENIPYLSIITFTHRRRI